MVAATYALLGLYGVLVVARNWLDDQAGFQVFKQQYVILYILLLMIGTTGLYFTSVRIGTVMFVNGVIATLLMFEVQRVLRYGNPFAPAVGDAQ